MSLLISRQVLFLTDFSSSGAKRKHISTEDQALTQQQSSLHPVNVHQFTPALHRCLSLSLFTFFASSISWLFFFLQCRVSTVIPVTWGLWSRKTITLPALTVEWPTCFLCDVIQPKICPNGKPNSKVKARFIKNNLWSDGIICLQPLHCDISIYCRSKEKLSISS